MHVPEEAEVKKSITDEIDEKEAAEAEAERDILAEQVEAEPKIMPEVVMAATTIIREAYAQGASSKDNVILTIAEVQELCDLAIQYPYVDGDYTVLGPEVFVDEDEGVISWKSENYYKTTPPVKMPEMSLEQRLEERRAYMRRDSMEWAVKLISAEGPSIQASSARASAVVQTAQTIYDWLTADQK